MMTMSGAEINFPKADHRALSNHLQFATGYPPTMDIVDNAGVSQFLPEFFSSVSSAVFIAGIGARTALTLASQADFVLESVLNSPSFIRHVAQKVDEISHSNDLWREFVVTPSASVDVDAISTTIENVFATISNFGYGAIDLTGIRESEANGEHLASVLRVTASMREFTPGWGQALRVATAALQRAGVDPEDALFGII